MISPVGGNANDSPPRPLAQAKMSYKRLRGAVPQNALTSSGKRRGRHKCRYTYPHSPANCHPDLWPDLERTPPGLGWERIGG